MAAVRFPQSLALACGALAAIALLPGCTRTQTARPEAAPMEQRSGQQIGDAAALVSGAPEGLLQAAHGAVARTRAGIARLKAMPAPRRAREALEAYDEATAALND